MVVKTACCARRNWWRWLVTAAVGVSISVTSFTLYAKKSKPQKADAEAEEGNGSKRTDFWNLMTLYGSGEKTSIAEANGILDSLLPRNESAKVDPTDKFGHAADRRFLSEVLSPTTRSAEGAGQMGHYRPRQSYPKLLLSGAPDQLQYGPHQLHVDVPRSICAGQRGDRRPGSAKGIPRSLQ